MNETNTERKRTVAPDGVKIIVKHEYVGQQSVEDALLPVILADLGKRIMENRTIDTDAQNQ